jgi:hypothetical protein
MQTDAERMQRRSLPSQPRQCGLLTLRMFWPPYCGGPGMPQRAMTMSPIGSGTPLEIGVVTPLSVRMDAAANASQAPSRSTRRRRARLRE